MKIHKIEINNYKGFYGPHSIELGGKNLLLYGENGSGKSSLYYALNDFFECADYDIDFAEHNNKLNTLRNYFDTSNKAAEIKIIWQRSDLTTIATEWLIDEAHPFADVDIFDSVNYLVKAKPLFNSKKVASFSSDKFDFFKDIIWRYFRHYKYLPTQPTLYTQIFSLAFMCDKRESKYNTPVKEIFFNDVKVCLDALIIDLNDPIHGLNKFVAQFGLDITVQVDLGDFSSSASLLTKYRGIITSENKNTVVQHWRPSILELLSDLVILSVKHRKVTLNEPHISLNEARRSALTLASMFYSMAHPQNEPGDIKLLIFDDPLLGIDNGNRQSFVNILNNMFADRQILLFTHDRSWFQFAKKLFSESDWSFKEMYSTINETGFPDVKILPSFSNRAKAKQYIKDHDYLAAGNYFRRELEELVKSTDYLPFLRITDPENITSLFKQLDHQRSFVEKCGLDFKPWVEVNNWRGLLLNPMSHYSPDLVLYKLELGKVEAAIDSLIVALAPFKISKFFTIGLDDSIVLRLESSAKVIFNWAISSAVVEKSKHTIWIQKDDEHLLGCGSLSIQSTCSLPEKVIPRASYAISPSKINSLFLFYEAISSKIAASPSLSVNIPVFLPSLFLRVDAQGNEFPLFPI